MMQALDAHSGWVKSADLEKVAGIFSLSQLVEAATPLALQRHSHRHTQRCVRR